MGVDIMSVLLCQRVDVAWPRSVSELQGSSRSHAALPRCDEGQSVGTSLCPDAAV